MASDHRDGSPPGGPGPGFAGAPVAQVRRRPHHRGPGRAPRVIAELTAASGRDRLDIVDAGGGTGGFAVPLAGLGHPVTVIDPSPDSLAAAQRRAAEMAVPLHAIQGDASRPGRPGRRAERRPGAMPQRAGVRGFARRPRWPRSRPSCARRRGRACWPQRGGGGHPPGPGRPVRRGRRLLAGTGGQPRRSRGPAAEGRGAARPRRFTLAGVTGLIEEAGLRPGPAHGVRVFADLVPGVVRGRGPGRRGQPAGAGAGGLDAPGLPRLRGPVPRPRVPVSRLATGQRGRGWAGGGPTTPAATSCTWTWTPSTPAWRSVTGRTWPGNR